MRYNSNRYAIKGGTRVRLAQNVFKLVLLALLFSFVFCGLSLAMFDSSNSFDEVPSLNVAEASKSTASVEKKLGLTLKADTLTYNVDLDAESGVGEAANDGFNNSSSGSSLVIDDGMHTGTDNEALWVNYVIDGDLFDAIKNGVATLTVTGSASKTSNTDKGGLLVTAKSSKTDYTNSTAATAVTDAVAGYELTTTATTKTYTFNAQSFKNFTSKAYILILLAGTDSHTISGQWGAVYYNNVKFTVTLKKYTITLDKGLATNSPTTTVTVVGGTALPSITTLPSATGYDFKGFYTSATNTTQIITSAGKAKNSTTYFNSSGKWIYNGNVTLYAQFDEHTGTITYNANGGTGSKTQNIKYSDGNITLADSGFTRNNYTLAGWATTAAAFDAKYMLGQSVSVQSGDFSLASDTTKSFTLYAVWKQSDYGVLDGKSRTDGTWGSENNPFVIETTQHLLNLSNIVGGAKPFDSVTGKSTMSVTTQATDTAYTNSYFIVTANISATSLNPIGSSSTLYFAGNISGYDTATNTKANRTITLSTNIARGYAGLFGYAKSGKFEYLTVAGSVVGGGAYVGGLIGYANGVTVENCINRASVSAGTSTYYDSVGGIIGCVIGNTTLTNCTNYGKIDGKIAVGGIVGDTNNSAASSITINGCASSSTIKGTSGTGGVGGILGRALCKITISNCTFSGTVTGTANGVGGILGYTTTQIYANSISGCKVSGTVSGGINVGGIAGRIGITNVDNVFEIVNCYNEATVSQTNASSTGTVGGIVGYFHVNCAHQNARIYNCVNVGAVNCADKNIGGIAGNIDGASGASVTVEYCYNLGTISDAKNGNRGGLVGIATQTAVSNSWNFHQIQGSQDSSNTIGSHVKVDNSVNSVFYPAKDANDVESTNWSLVADGTVYRAFRIFASEYTIANGNYLRIYSQASKSVVPSAIVTTESAPNDANSAVKVANAVFASDIKDSANNTINILTIEVASIKATSVIEKTFRDFAVTANEWLVLSDNKYATAFKVFYKVNGVFTETAPTQADTYSVKLSLYNEDVLIGDIALTYKITKINLGLQTTTGVYDLPFGYTANGVASNTFFDKIGDSFLYQLERKTGGVLFATGDSPYSLVYKDNKDYYKYINNYLIFHKYIDENNDTIYHALDASEVSYAISGGTLNGNEISFDNANVLSVVITLTGIGNYEGTREIRFTLMSSDFGFEGANFGANWGGSDTNPYLIENPAHLIRLSEIVNGAPAWNSINSDDTTLAYYQNTDAKATDRSYRNAYFRVTSGISVGTVNGFESIGTSADYPFEGFFKSTDYVITLTVNESGDYVGLFGYLLGATLTDVTVDGSVSGNDYVGAVAGFADLGTTFIGTITNSASVKGRNFVGGIVGRLDCALTNAYNTGAVTGTRAVGGLIGYLRGTLTSSQNSGKVTYTANTSEFNDEVFVTDGGVHFNAIGGLVGFINTNGVRILNCVNTTRNAGGTTTSVSAAGARGVGGIVGFVNVSSGSAFIEADTDTPILSEMAVTGLSYVGGIVGYGFNVTIDEDCVVNGNITGSGSLSQYTGGIAGKWVVNDASQMPGQRTVRSSINIDGYTYVGGLVGWLDARNAVGLTLTPFISNNSTTNNIGVLGHSYVGALYGGFEGYGYRRSSLTVSDDDTKVLVNPGNFTTGSTRPYIFVNITAKAGGRVVGGLIGYASGVGILFLGDYVGVEHTPFTFRGTTSFFGGIVGVIGENATIESAKQIDNGVEVGMETHSVRYRNASGDTDLAVGGDFVGSIAGYVASTAGVYISSDTTLMGNHVQLYNDNVITAKSYVGGLFGAFGKVSSYTNADQNLQNLVRYGKYGTTASGPNNTLRYAPSDDGGLGKAFNLRSIVGTGNYVGGIVGYVGDSALLAFRNDTVDSSNFKLTDANDYLSVYNGYGLNPTAGVTTIIRGANYVGGIAGYVSSMSHELYHVISLMTILASSDGSTENGDYAGGIFGYMGGGSIMDSIAYSGVIQESKDSNTFRGRDYVGGIVGMLAGGSISGSVTRGFKVENTSLTKGGIAGSVNAGATIESSWTIYVKDFSNLSSDESSRKYASVSANTNGSYVLVDSSVVLTLTPSFAEFARMVGLFTSNVGTTIASSEKYNPIKSGFMSISANIPKSHYSPTSTGNASIKDKQLVFYDVSGNDKSTDNTFDQMGDDINYTNSISWDLLNGANDRVFFRFDMASTHSFSICVIDIEFDSIQSYTGNNNATARAAIAKAYRKPASKDDRYGVDIMSAPAYDNLGTMWVTGVATYEGYGVDPLNPNKTTREIVVLGTICTKFDKGSSEAMAIVISSQTEWDNFAESVRKNTGGVNGYANKFIKLDLKPGNTITVTANNLAGVLGATSTSNTVFKGTFDGNGQSIKINVSSATASALNGMSVFPSAAGATFKNLTITGDITATGDALSSTDAANVAGFVAVPQGTLTFENCTNEVNVTTFRSAGGFVADSNNNKLTLITCVNKGTIETKEGNDSSYGEMEKADYDKDGKYYFQYEYGTGGLVGRATGTIVNNTIPQNIIIESCKNEGVVKGGNNVGGIIGYGQRTSVQIYNSANTKDVTSHLGLTSEPKNTEGLSYVGGIIGKTGDKSYLRMYASYNSGKIVGYGSIVGGLAGGVGEFYFPGKHPNLVGYISTSKNQIHQGGQSIIAYCYNNGEVHVGGTTSTGKESTWNALGRETPNGSIVGGIVGAIGYGIVNYCYNQGKIVGHNIVGYLRQWQMRMGGIAGQAQPTATGSSVSFNYCYNIGIIEVDIAQTAFAGNPAYGTGICGYMDEGDGDGTWDTQTTTTAVLKSRLSGSNNYVLQNSIHFKNSSTSTDSYYTSVMIPTGSTAGIEQTKVESGRYIDGTQIDYIADFTTYMGSDSNYYIRQSVGNSTKPYNVSNYNQASSLIDSNGNYLAEFDDHSNTVDYAPSFLDGTQYGYVYIYGCLPQLAVFALDTKEGLSMLSVSYGKNEYDAFVGNQAGSKESPYVIKDGVGLLAMSALTGATSKVNNTTGYYNFNNKYITFADGANNIEGMSSKYINMSMTSSGTEALKSSSSGSSYTQIGKNYFLWQQGAASGKTTLSYGTDSDRKTAAQLLSMWQGYNYYFNGTAMTNGSSFSANANMYPIGNGTTPFAGNISGLQGESGNTVVANIKISQRSATNSFAGLFGTIYDATVSNITVAGVVNGYTTSNTYSTYRVFAGGIVGYAGGDSIISDCQAGYSGGSLAVNAYGASTTVATSTSAQVYAGAIAGAAGPAAPNATTASFKTLEIMGSRAGNAKVKSIRNNMGGIVGYVGNPWKSTTATSGRGNVVNLTNVYVYNTTIEAITGVNANNVGTDIGGIVGTNDGDTSLVVDGAYVGKVHPNATSTTLSVYVYGENSFGGVIGKANGNTAVGNVEVTQNATIQRKGYDTVTNTDGSTTSLYRTAIGGVVGRAISGTINTLRDSIVFNGIINVNVANTSLKDDNPTGNIGGIIGAMGSGTRFLSGSSVEVTGKINSTLTSDKFVRNIGGVAGATIDGAFDGTFIVSPTISAPNATNIGGFIGRNFGEANILASAKGTRITINANITGLSQIGGLVGMNGYKYATGLVVGRLQIGADTFLGGRYDGDVVIEIESTAKITAKENDAGGLIGANIASDANQGIVITKGSLKNFGTVTGINNVGGLIGNNEGNIQMGGSSVATATLQIQNAGSIVGENNVGGVIGYLQRGSIAGRYGNTGSVTGNEFVGGSIGRVDNDAELVSAGNDDTYFYNGNEYASNGTEEAIVVADSAGNGNVKGVRYVGGSIGGLFGAVIGSAEHNVRFINAGEVQADSFMGGNIGLLAGSIDYAQFTNSGQIVANGSNAIGGSVGFVGILRSDLANDTYTHRQISILNTHFEFVGDNDMSVLGNAVEDEDFEWGGVGGAIGVIGGSANGFENDGSKWQNVTLYTASGINAPNIYNVGGAIGLIKANNIVISNMLAFYTSITGSKNVGGIIGAVTGHNIKINDSFNIEGTVAGNTAGGIVGYALEGDTVADTSYWVKGYSNEELMALDISQVVDTLGVYIAVSDGKNVFTKELTDAYQTPANYTGKESDGTSPNDWKAYLTRIAGKDVDLHNDVWSYTSPDATGYTTGESHTGWYYVFANNRSGLDTTHISAQDNQNPSILSESEREAELKYWKYIANAYTAEELQQGANAKLNSPIVGEINGTTVTGNGELTQGYIYAAARESQVSGYYLYMDASGVKPDIYYGEPTTWNDVENNVRPFYLIAKTSLNGEGDTNAQNVAVYYRSVGIGGTLTYNGYKRFVPITDDNDIIKYLSSDDMLEDGKSGDYVYTMDKVVKNNAVINQEEVIEAGTYLTKVTIYYYDSLGKYGKIGGIGLENDYSTYGELIIKELPLGVKLTVKTDNAVYEGDNTNGSIELTVDGIAPLDNGVNKLNGSDRSVSFTISGEKTTNIIDGKLNIGKLMAALGKDRTGTVEFTTSSADRNKSKELMPFASDKIYMSKYTVARTTDSDRLSAWKNYCNCIVDDDYVNGVISYRVTVTFRFVETIDDNFNVVLDKNGINKNYEADDISEPFKIEPKELKLKLLNGYTSMGKFNNVTHNTGYYFDGWVAKDKANATALIKGLDPYIEYTGAGQKNQGVFESSKWESLTSNCTNKYFTAGWLANTTQFNLSGMIDEGQYTISFKKALVDGKLLTEDGNYYIVFEEDPLYSITENELQLSWSLSNTATYDAKYHWLVASFKPVEPFGSPEALANELKTLFPDGAVDAKVVQGTASLATVEFRVGPNAGTHQVELPGGSNAHTENCKIQNAKNGEYIIKVLDIAVGLSGNDQFVYNGGYHQASGISPSCPSNTDAKPIIVSYNATSGEYTLQMFGNLIENDIEDNQIKFALSYDGGVAAVNVGKYNAVISEGSIRPVSTNKNFNVTTSGQGSLEIIAAEITLGWSGVSSFTYDKTLHGRSMTGTLVKMGDGLTQSGSIVYNPASNTSATFRVINAFNNNTETFTIPVDGTRSAINASSYIASVDLNKVTISGKNGAGNAQLSNYIINFANAASGNYTIQKRTLSVSSISNAETTKTYDATVSVKLKNNAVGTAVFRDGSVVPDPSNVTVTGEYNTPSVGTNKKIIYTITLKDNNYQFMGGSSTTTFTRENCVIEHRQLTVRLDMLRNNTATKTYDATSWYGGAAGALSIASETSATSAIHRSGEGFRVIGIAQAETLNGAVVIKANYKEATLGREAFDAYVNNVVGSGANIGVGTSVYGDENYNYKNIVFTLEGSSAENYKFVVNITGINDNICDGESAGTSTHPLTLSKDSGVKIEITPYIVRATYDNTAQSYATADNTYNTNWVDVSGSALGVGGLMLPLSVVNNWKYQNNNPDTAIPAQFTSHTVIRGALNSTVLSAQLANTADGTHVNYRLSNQPILTIGYFVDKDEFEIGSVASLMIATYYFALSRGEYDNEFGVIVSQAVWELLVSAKDYANGNTDNLPSTVIDKEGNEIAITSWDEYFAWLATDAGGNISVFLNEYEGENSGWGYYRADESSASKKYDKFKQIANISGVFTAQDLAILNGMFTKVTIDADGNVVPDKSYTWGVGGDFLNNFIKASEGNVVTAIGSIFGGVFDGSYDGNGYTIDGVNIVGIANDSSNAFGMFERIGARDGTAAGVVQNVHLRNFNITVYGEATEVFAGGIAGVSEQSEAMTNVSVHASMTVNVIGRVYVGGLFGVSRTVVNGAIVLGNIDVTATRADVGGAVGENRGAGVVTDNAVSLMYIWVTASANSNVNGLVGSETASKPTGVNAFMQQAVYLNGATVSDEGETFSDLYAGSMGGYTGASTYYYTGDDGNVKGMYDVLADIKLTKMDGEDLSRSNPHESMRLADIIDIYLLMYAKTAKTVKVDGVDVDVFGITNDSWLVGIAHGTDSSPIVISNQQGIALLRELRFATFTVNKKIYAYSSYLLSTARGAFFGKVVLADADCGIYIQNWDGSQKMFEVEVGAQTPTSVLKNGK